MFTLKGKVCTASFVNAHLSRHKGAWLLAKFHSATLFKNPRQNPELIIHYLCQLANYASVLLQCKLDSKGPPSFSWSVKDFVSYPIFWLPSPVSHFADNIHHSVSCQKSISPISLITRVTIPMYVNVAFDSCSNA